MKIMFATFKSCAVFELAVWKVSSVTLCSICAGVVTPIESLKTMSGS